MKKMLTSAILVAIVLVVLLPVPVGARFAQRYSEEPYYGGAYWKDDYYNTVGIYGENYIYDQNTGSTFWQEFVAEMKVEIIYNPYFYFYGPTYWITTGYYQFGASYPPRHFVRWQQGFGSGPYVDWHEFPPLETHRYYFILGFGSDWGVWIDGMQRKWLTFPPELDACNIEGLTSKRDYYGSCYSWYDQLKQWDSVYGWLYWDGYLHNFDTIRVATYVVNGHCFGTYAE